MTRLTKAAGLTASAQQQLLHCLIWTEFFVIFRTEEETEAVVRCDGHYGPARGEPPYGKRACATPTQLQWAGRSRLCVHVCVKSSVSKGTLTVLSSDSDATANGCWGQETPVRCRAVFSRRPAGRGLHLVETLPSLRSGVSLEEHRRIAIS